MNTRNETIRFSEGMAKHQAKREEAKQMMLEGIIDLQEGRTASHADALKELEQWGKE